MEPVESLAERLHALEEAYEYERKQRDLLEKKYARLKRRYVRLERAHAHLIMETPTSDQEAYISRTNRGLTVETSLGQIDNIGSSTSDVIDLTTPRAQRRHQPGQLRRSMSSSFSPPHHWEIRNSSEQALTIDEVCPESPLSPITALLPTRQEPVRAIPRQLSYSLRTSPEATQRITNNRRRHLENSMRDPVSRPCPRLGSATQMSRSVQHQSTRTLDLPSTRGSTPSSARSSPTEADTFSSGVTSNRNIGASNDSDEAASIRLAQYLQHQEELELYQSRRRVQDALHAFHQPTYEDHRQYQEIDPDNMTYDQLLALGQQVGDVKQERWREISVQVLSRLPTHRWTSSNTAEISCIICQYNFQSGDVALTLPCAHVFHDDCVSGWIHENNSCPLCKLAIADI